MSCGALRSRHRKSHTVVRYSNIFFMQGPPPPFTQRRKDTSYDYNRITFLKLVTVEKKTDECYHAVQRPR